MDATETMDGVWLGAPSMSRSLWAAERLRSDRRFSRQGPHLRDAQPQASALPGAGAARRGAGVGHAPRRLGAAGGWGWEATSGKEVSAVIRL